MSEATRRRILGISALVLLAASPALWFGSSRAGVQALGGMAFKAGLAFGAAWLAFPQVTSLANKLSPRMKLGLFAGLAILLFRPKNFLLVAAALAVLAVLEVAGWILKPPNRPSGSSRNRS
jgi:hypothetical protein